MGKEIENELEPMYFYTPGFGQMSILELLDNQNKVLPVYTQHKLERGRSVDFFLLFVKESGKTYLQAEGFASDEMQQAFEARVSDLWQTVQPGIIRLDITEMIKKVL